MKEKWDIQYLRTFLPALGLALLLLVSPCKVRNFIQVELGTPQTDVSSKSKSSLSTADCHSFDLAEFSDVKNKEFTNKVPCISTSLQKVDESNSICILFPVRSSTKRAVTDIPLYILYQNFKDYI